MAHTDYIYSKSHDAALFQTFFRPSAELSNQIFDVVALTSIRPHQKQLFLSVLTKISTAVSFLDPQAVVAPYGSIIAGTALDSSNYNISILRSRDSNMLMGALASALMEEIPHSSTETVLIRKAFALRLKLTSGAHFLITFDHHEAVITAHILHGFLKDDAEARIFITFVKALLRDHHIVKSQMNSIAITMVCHAFLREWRKGKQKSQSSSLRLGEILLGFLGYFETQGVFNPSTTHVCTEGILIAPQPSPFSLWIVKDPCTGESVAAGCYRAHEVRALFSEILRILTSRFFVGIHNTNAHLVQLVFPLLALECGRAPQSSAPSDGSSVGVSTSRDRSNSSGA